MTDRYQLLGSWHGRPEYLLRRAVARPVAENELERHRRSGYTDLRIVRVG